MRYLDFRLSGNELFFQIAKFQTGIPVKSGIK